MATDNCNVASFSGSHSSGDIFTLGNTVVSYLAADDAGNSSICSFTITVEELMPPLIINCPINIVVGNAPGLCSSVVTWAPPSATDVCGVPLLTGNYAPGSTFPVGNTMVLYTATDASGLTASCNFIVTVEDTETPTITLVLTTLP